MKASWDEVMLRLTRDQARLLLDAVNGAEARAALNAALDDNYQDAGLLRVRRCGELARIIESALKGQDEKATD